MTYLCLLVTSRAIKLGLHGSTLPVSIEESAKYSSFSHTGSMGFKSVELGGHDITLIPSSQKKVYISTSNKGTCLAENWRVDGHLDKEVECVGKR